MKKLTFFASLVMVALIGSSCGKTESPTTFRINVVDFSGAPVQYAVVNLYQSYADYNNNVNSVATATTDANGSVYFSRASSIVYFFSIERSGDCTTNATSTYETSGPLSAGNANSITVTVYETGQINLSNTSNDPYSVFINGTYWNTMAGGTTQSVLSAVGSYNVEVRQQSGYTGYPTDEKFTVNVADCYATNLNFP